MDETSIGGYYVLDELGMSKRFRSFRASRRAPDGQRQGTLYLMTEEVGHPEVFIETVDAIRAAWPFAADANRDVVLPEAQLWTGRPWFFLPDSLPVAASVRIAGRAAFAALTAQLRWLQQFQPPGGEGEFAHGDVRKERIAVFDAEQPLLIAPGWVAASDYARGADLSHVRGDDTWHLGKLWIKDSDHSFVPEGMEPDPTEAARRLPRAVLAARIGERAGLDTPLPAPARAAAPAADDVASPRARVAAAEPAKPSSAAVPAKPSSAAVPAKPPSAAVPARAPAPAPARKMSGPFASPAAAPARAPTAPPGGAARTSPFAAPVSASASTPAAPAARAAAANPTAPAARAAAASPPAPAARAVASQATPAPAPAERPVMAAEAPVAVTVPAPKPRARPVAKPEIVASPPAFPDEVITSAPPLPAKGKPAPAVMNMLDAPQPIAELPLEAAVPAGVASNEAASPAASPAAPLSARPSAPLGAPLAPAERKGKGAVILALVVLVLLLIAAALFLKSRS